MCKILIRRRICTAHNFANKPVFFACDGVQMRQRVSYKPDTKESGRTARNSRNASRVWKKILPKAAQRAASGARCSIQSADTHNRNGRARLRTVGEYKGEKEDRSKSGKKAQRSTAKTFGVA